MMDIKHNANFFLWFGDKPGREKITVGTDEKGHHYTMMYNGRKKTINFHKSFELGNGKKDYELICEISWYSFLRLIVAVNKSNMEFLKQFWFGKRINLGKLNRYDMIAFPLSSDKVKTGDLFNTSRKKKISLKKNIAIESFFGDSLYPDELVEFDQGGLLVYSTKRGHMKFQGIILKIEGDLRSRSFCFVSKNNLSKYTKEMSLALRNTLSRLNFTNKDKVLTNLTS